MVLGRLVGILALLIVPFSSAAGQDVGAMVELDGKPAEVIARFGPATVLLSHNAPYRYRDRRHDDEHMRMPYQWYMVQDSSIGVVFRKRSGIKGG